MAPQVATAKTTNIGPAGRHPCRSDSTAATDAQAAATGMINRARCGLGDEDTRGDGGAEDESHSGLDPPTPRSTDVTVVHAGEGAERGVEREVKPAKPGQ